MSTKQTLGISLLFAVLAALLVGSSMVLYVLRDVPEASGSVPVFVSEDFGERLSIPSLSIDAKIQSVGQTLSGSMGAPSNFSDVGWFREGTVPGEQGSAVMAGHLDNALAFAGVFKHLRDAGVGADVYVRNATGEKVHFRVVRVEEYPYDQVPLTELFEKQDGIYLNLVTCAGKWMQVEKTYGRRLVVYTELVS